MAEREQGHRLYVKGRHLSFKRGRHNSTPKISLLQIENVTSTEDAQFYLGKRVAFVYTAKTEKRGTKYRVIWGTICRTHGSSGVCQARFTRALPSKSLGGRVRIMLYPSSI